MMKNHGVNEQATLSELVDQPEPSSNDRVRIEAPIMIDEAQMSWRKKG